MSHLLGRARARLQLSPARSALAALLLLAALAASIAACSRTKQLDLIITVPSALVDQTRWIELSVYDNVQCNLAGRVSYGEAPVAGPIKRLLFSPGDDMSKVPALGDLPSGYYAFVAQVKNEKCQVIARGCDGLEIGSADTVRIGTKPDETIGPECGAGLSCQLAQCLPQRAGQNCSLDVIGSGPLSVYDDPTGNENQETEGLAVAAPAVRSMGDRFLVSYGQFDVNDGDKTTLIAQPIARNGGLFPYAHPDLSGRCVNYPQDDGTALAWSPADATGVVAMSRTQCSDSGEPANTAVTVVGFDSQLATPRSTTLSLSGAASAPTRTIAFGQNQGVASLGGGEWLIAPIVWGQAEAIVLRESGSGPSAGFEVVDDNGPARVQFGLRSTADVLVEHVSASVAASSTSVVLVAVNHLNGDLPVIPISDAGVDDAGGGDAGNDGGSGGLGRPAPPFREGEITDANSQVSVQFLPIDRLNSSAVLPEPFVTSSRFASAALVDNRAFVVADSPGSVSDPTLFALDYNPNDNAGIAPIAENYAILTNGEAQSTEVDYADVAVADDRVFVATAIPGDVILTLFGTAATGPSVIRSIRLSQVRASTVGSIRDGRVSVTVDRNRVIVVWTTAKVLKANDPMGGYVIFACEPPT